MPFDKEEEENLNKRDFALRQEMAELWKRVEELEGKKDDTETLDMPDNPYGVRKAEGTAPETT
jgi:hypothetical protein